jgi:hypothetical protein
MENTANDSTSKIGTLNEKPLHAAIKSFLTKPSDIIEAEVDGFVVDILRKNLAIEIQTKNFSQIRNKIKRLILNRPVRLIYPIPKEKWIIKMDQDLKTSQSRRKSPKKGTYKDIFAELVSFPDLILQPNFSVEVLLIQEEELRKHVPGQAWRRKGWITHERRLLQVVEQRRFAYPGDFVALLPQSIQGEFTTRDLRITLNLSARLAGQMAYCLREMGAIKAVGNRGRAILYARNSIFDRA